jgi:hypothetical protein
MAGAPFNTGIINPSAGRLPRRRRLPIGGLSGPVETGQTGVIARPLHSPLPMNGDGVSVLRLISLLKTKFMKIILFFRDILFRLFDHKNGSATISRIH